MIPLKRSKHLLGLLLCLCFSWTEAASIEGRVIKIADGDTLTLLQNGIKFRVRLADIQAPEKGRPYSAQATRSLTFMCLGKAATVEVLDTDKYGRTVGRVFCDGIDANREQILRGMAKVYTRYLHDHSLSQDQTFAQINNKGLWKNHKRFSSRFGR